MSILLYGCTTWTLTKWMAKRLDDNYTRMLRAILNKSRWRHLTKHQLYGHLPPISKTIKVKRTRHTGHCWRSKNELISDIILWISLLRREKKGRPARICIRQISTDTEYSLEDLPGAMDDRDGWQERVREICVGRATWCYIYIYIVKYIVSWPTVVEGDPNAPLSIATQRRCKWGLNSFPCIPPLYPWSVPYNAEC